MFRTVITNSNQKFKIQPKIQIYLIGVTIELFMKNCVQWPGEKKNKKKRLEQGKFHDLNSAALGIKS